MVSEGHDTVSVYLRTRTCGSVLNTCAKGHRQMVKVGSDWENWKTRYDGRTSTRQRVNSRFDVVKLSESFALGLYSTQSVSSIKCRQE